MQRTAEVSRRQFLFVVGKIGFTWLDVMILGYLLFLPLFLIAVPRLIKRRERQGIKGPSDAPLQGKRPHRITLVVMILVFLLSLGVMPFLASTIIDNIRKCLSYEKTTCTILDKKAGWLSKQRGAYPIFAVRYDGGGREIISAGFPRKRCGDKASGNVYRKEDRFV